MNTKLEVRYGLRHDAKLRKMYSSFFSPLMVVIQRLEKSSISSATVRESGIWWEILLYSRTKWNEMSEGDRNMSHASFIWRIAYRLRIVWIACVSIEAKREDAFCLILLDFGSQNVYFHIKIKDFKKKHLVGNILTCIENKRIRTMNVKNDLWPCDATQRIANESIKWKMARGKKGAHNSLEHYLKRILISVWLMWKKGRKKYFARSFGLSHLSKGGAKLFTGWQLALMDKI